MILNEAGVFDYAPPNNDVPATCRILEGVRYNMNSPKVTQIQIVYNIFCFKDENANIQSQHAAPFRTDCMPGEPMPAVTYDNCTKLGCCHVQISTDASFCHHKIPSMHTYNVSAGLF